MTQETQTTDFSATLKSLRAKVDKKNIKKREGYRDRNGNTHDFEYIEWHAVADILDDVAPTWTHSVKNIEQIGDVMTVVVAITIDGITREGIGTGAAATEMGIKKAEHDALKRAAVKFGVARELYKKESDEIERRGSTSNNTFDIHNPPEHPVANSLASLVTVKQLGMIRALARELRIEADEDCNALLACRTDELSKSAASWLIGYLKSSQQGLNAANKTPSDTVGNVTPIDKRSGGMSVDGKARLLVEGGCVSKVNDHYEVREMVNRRQTTFKVVKTEDAVACNCADYEKHKADPAYTCVHKSAVRCFTSLDQRASA